MSVDFRTRNQLLLAKVESASGTEETPVVGSNAMRVKSPLGFSPSFELVETEFARGSLTKSQPIIGGGTVGMRLSTFLMGSGAAGTTAPDIGTLLRACAMSQTATSAAVTGTAQAGAASTITLAAGASATNNAYKGMPISTTGGTGAGQKRVITGYVGSTKVATVTPAWTTQPDATTTYSIPANHLYRPVDAGAETVTLWAYQKNSGSGSNAVLRRLMGGAGSFTLNVSPRNMCQLEFNISGQLPANPSSVSEPSAATFQSADPQPFLDGLAYLGDGAVQFSEFSFDLGASVTQFDNPAAALGYDVGQVTDRGASGRITANLVLPSVRDIFTDWRAGTSKALWLDWGATAGQKVSLLMPEIRYSSYEPGDTRNYATEQIGFRSVQEAGEIFICLH